MLQKAPKHGTMVDNVPAIDDNLGAAPKLGTAVDMVLATEDPPLEHVLDTPPTFPKEPHVIELFPHDLSSPQVELVYSKKPKIFAVAKNRVPGIYHT